ncbi:hypothetical protein BUY42_12015, partial [Staphylococcus devriesei]
SGSFKTIIDEKGKYLMDGYYISGYINNNKNLAFTVGMRSTENFNLMVI